ncbi:MAG: (Fe-S)-binding protein [candidate division Zixibacteria bacterium]|nr:(Fe-S)-binding protein [candidate division Zixibacteria bacterium]
MVNEAVPAAFSLEWPITQTQLDKIVAAFDAAIDRDLAAQMLTCVHCGLCADSCHYYLTDPRPENIPAHKAEMVAGLYRRNHTLSGRLFPSLNHARPMDAARAAEWIDSLYGRCSLCARCTVNCTVGIGLHQIIRAGRTALAAAGLVPSALQSTVDRAVETGNNMGISRDEWLETIEWLTDELRNETGDPDALLPIDKPDCDYLYAINPREAKFYPLSLLAAGKLFYAAGISWTFASDHYDVTNYGLFSGDNEISGMISGRLQETAARLNAKAIILGECGHGYNANRWEGPEWRGKPHERAEISILEIIQRSIQEGRIVLDPKRHATRVTLHDPCNLVRLGGVIEPQRSILSRAVSEFVEMTPNLEKNFCCGGGGGQLSMTRYADRRILAGRIKADQIAATEAKVVVAPCHNCIDQLSELNRQYKLGVEIKTVTEMVADALVLAPRSAVTSDGGHPR